jgi:hypothetical protein
MEMVLDPAARTEEEVSHDHPRVRPSTPPLCQTVVDRLLADNPEYRRHLTIRTPRNGTLRDFVFATPEQPHLPEDVFPSLRWGGLYVFASRKRRQVVDLSHKLGEYGFAVEIEPTCIHEGRRWLPFLSRKVHTLVARKTRLLPPGGTTDRFTYDVQLAPHESNGNGHAAANGDSWVVLKQIPALEAIVSRLRKKFPDAPDATLERNARKFTEKIFPTFLTREAAMLMILEEHLPASYARRVPRLIDVEKDDRGFVRRLRMRWLRNGGEPLPHMEFARQSADLLRVVHDIARVIHLDLRLDNFVITEHGVGFVDFGSAVRVNEDLSRNPLLSSLFGELLRTSQIQRMMEQMTLSGAVTSKTIRDGCHKADKSADFFYLAVQFNSPHSNPDLSDLIDYDPTSTEARDLARLTHEILRPANPQLPAFRSAKDILHGVERIQLGLDRAW